MKKLSLITLFLIVVYFLLNLIFSYSKLNSYPKLNGSIFFFADFFKINSCLDKGDLWDYENKKCNDTESKIKTINISDWKIYEDNTYDFKIKYSESWADPQIQEIDTENSPYQYQVKFGTEKTLNGNGNEGFSILISKKNAINKNADTCNCVCVEMQDNLDQEISQELYSPNLFSKAKQETDNHTACYSYHFMGQYFEYKLIPISNDESNLSLLKDHNLQNFELAKNTFVINFESIKEKAIKLAQEQEQARLIAIERARQARIAAERARQAQLRTCKHPERKPSYSTTKKKHMDEDCCPDPDEWPDPKCRYSAKDYKIMLKKR